MFKESTIFKHNKVSASMPCVAEHVTSNMDAFPFDQRKFLKSQWKMIVPTRKDRCSHLKTSENGVDRFL